MTDADTVETTASIIERRFRNAGILKVAIVDDAYDAITNEIIADTIDDFVGSLKNDEHLNEVRKLCPAVTEPDNFDLDAAKLLWEQRKAWPEKITPLTRALYTIKFQRVERLDNLSAALSRLNLEVIPLGIAAVIDNDVRLVFLDYQLEPEKEKALAQADAQALVENNVAASPRKTRAEEIAHGLSARGANRPYLVLISTLTNLADLQAGFRERTNYVGGTFGFLVKEWAANEQDLLFHLRSWGIGHPALPAVTNFISAVADSAEDIARRFRKTLLELDAQDYSFLQRLSLTEDGEPLGDYILHLLSESLSHRLRNHLAVVAARATLDEISFSEHLPSIVQPRGIVAQLYREAFTDHGPAPLAPHPLQKHQQPAPPKVLPRINQGDIFASACRTHVYVVINPGCDLQYSPMNPGRHPDPESALFLIKGDLVPYPAQPLDIAAMRTEPFEIGGVPYRIVWQLKSTKAIPHREIETWSQTERYERIARLREIHAASLQQAWTARMSRIGLPVVPPTFSSADFRMLVNVGKDTRQVGSTVAGEIVLTQHWEERELVNRFTLTQRAVLRLKEAFGAALDSIQSQIDAVPEGQHKEVRTAALVKSLNMAKVYATDPGQLLYLLEGEFDLPSKNGAAWTEETRLPITFFRHANLVGKKWESIKGRAHSIVLIDILLPGLDNARESLVTLISQRTRNLEEKTNLASAASSIGTTEAHAIVRTGPGIVEVAVLPGNELEGVQQDIAVPEKDKRDA